MLKLNLVPLERRDSEIVSFDRHPFYASLLALSGPGGNPVIAQLSQADFATQAIFLNLIAQAHAALSIAAPLAFRRVAELSTDAETRRIARQVYDIEMGREPLVKGALAVPHLEQFRQLVESLLTGLCIDFPGAEAYPVHAALDLNRAPIAEALALCEELERSGRGIIDAWQDFVAQWQTFQGLPSARVARAYLSEHALVEGGNRLSLLDRMMAPYDALRASPDYAAARTRIRREFSRHFDETLEAIFERCLPREPHAAPDLMAMPELEEIAEPVIELEFPPA